MLSPKFLRKSLTPLKIRVNFKTFNIFSGQATEENVRRILGFGADAFLEKPMHKDQLLETVSRLIGEDLVK